MMTAIRQSATVTTDGRLSLSVPELTVGTVAEVIVLLPSAVSEQTVDGQTLPAGMAPTIAGRLAALDRLQEAMQLSPAEAEAWVRDVRAERDAWPHPREPLTP